MTAELKPELVDAAARALMAKHKEIWPGSWPALQDAKELAEAVISTLPRSGNGIDAAIGVVEKRIAEIEEIQDDDHALYEASFKWKSDASLSTLEDVLTEIRALPQPQDSTYQEMKFGTLETRSDGPQSDTTALVEALEWIEKRCPRRLQDAVDEPHRIHVEAAYDAGACAEAALKQHREAQG